MRTRNIFFIAAAIAAMVSCEKKPLNEDPQGYDALTPMTFSYNGAQTPVGQAFAESFTDNAGTDYIRFFATSGSGFASADALVSARSADYVMVQFTPDLDGQDISIDAYDVYVTAYRASDAAYFVYQPTDRSAITEGKMLASYDAGSNVWDVKMICTLADNSGMTLSATAEQTAYEFGHDNMIEFNGNADDVYSAFYLDSAGYSYLYFTAAQVDWFNADEFPLMSANQWVSIIIETDAMDGSRIDLANTSVGHMVYFSYDYGDNELSTGNIGMDASATGTLSVNRNGSTEFNVALDVTFSGGQTLRVYFDGAAKHVDDGPENPNVFTCGEDSWTINSVILDRTGGLKDLEGGECIEIWLSNASGCTSVDSIKENNPFHIVSPVAVLGSNVGFSMYKDEPNMYFEYGSRKWNYSIDPGTGSLSVSLSEDDSTITVDFRDWNELQGHYSGSFTYLQ